MVVEEGKVKCVVEKGEFTYSDRGMGGHSVVEEGNGHLW